MVETFVTALVLLNVGHWAADYTHLSTKWMLDAKRLGRPIVPIFLHSVVHGCIFSIIAACINFNVAWVIFVVQCISHFYIDLLKGRLNLWFPALQSPANPYHWYVFGFDQLLHQVVIIWLSFIIAFGI